MGPTFGCRSVLPPARGSSFRGPVFDVLLVPTVVIAGLLQPLTISQHLSLQHYTITSSHEFVAEDVVFGSHITRHRTIKTNTNPLEMKKLITENTIRDYIL